MVFMDPPEQVGCDAQYRADRADGANNRIGDDRDGRLGSAAQEGARAFL
jgi:hypothetical protein